MNMMIGNQKPKVAKFRLGEVVECGGCRFRIVYINKREKTLLIQALGEAESDRGDLAVMEKVV